MYFSQKDVHIIENYYELVTQIESSKQSTQSHHRNDGPMHRENELRTLHTALPSSTLHKTKKEEEKEDVLLKVIIDGDARVGRKSFSIRCFEILKTFKDAQIITPPQRRGKGKREGRRPEIDI